MNQVWWEAGNPNIPEAEAWILWVWGYPGLNSDTFISKEKEKKDC